MRKSVEQALTAEQAHKREKQVSDVIRHRSGRRKSCRTKSNVGSERVKSHLHWKW